MRGLRGLHPAGAVASVGLIGNRVDIRFDDVNETLESIARGDVLGRAVIVYD